MDPEVIVLAVITEGERFAVSRLDALKDAMFAGSLPWRPEEWQQAFVEFSRDLEWLPEDRVRVQLAGMGFNPDEVDHQLERARGFLDVEFTWERTTMIGFRNVFRQEVIRKTDLAGVAEGQRVFMLRCVDCGHEHLSDGCDVHARRCPSCQ
jgi:hypothetical protein